MKSREFIFWVFSLFLFFSTVLVGDTAGKVEEGASTVDLPVILKLAQRDRVITVKSDGRAPVYTVETRTGEVLVRDLRAEELKAANPELYQMVKNAIAVPAGVQDASLREQAF